MCNNSRFFCYPTDERVKIHERNRRGLQSGVHVSSAGIQGRDGDVYLLSM